MTRVDSGALGITRTILWVLIVLNWLQGVAIAAGMVASFVAPDWVMRAIGVPADDAGARVLLVLRVVMAIGMIATPLYHVILSRLGDIVRTVGYGDPFVGENAARLQLCAWVLFGLQVLRIGVAATANSVSTKAMQIDIEAVSLTGWLAVLALFVLAQVFRQGASLREDLAGTV